MGPTNVALFRLFQADSKLIEAQIRLDSATKNVRLQKNKVADLAARQAAAKAEHTKLQARAGELNLEITSRDEKINHLREQQNTSQTNREYQAHLLQINTLKVDKAKFEEEALSVMEEAEKQSAEAKNLGEQATAERAKLETMSGQIDERVKKLQAEIDAVKPDRDAAAAEVPQKAMQIYDRMAERYEGEAMEAIDKPHVKREEYIAMTCNIDLTVDVYNRLHSRDELTFCPQCGRILYIPDELTIDKAVHKPKEKKARVTKPRVAKVKKKDIGAPVALQTLATSVVTSVDEDEEQTAEAVAVDSGAEEVAEEQDTVEATQEESKTDA